jgi:hypothetical protein
LLHLVIRVVIDFDWHFICIVVQIDEAVIEEETTVAFLTIAVINLLTSLDVVQSLYNETSSVICVVPGSLSGSLVVEHVCIGHKTVGLDALNLDTENTRRDHHSYLRVFPQRELCKFRDLSANKIVISLYINNFLFNLI